MGVRTNQENPRCAEVRRAVRNIIVCSLDACSAGHFGCHGYFRDTTPCLDAAARGGVRFSRHFCQFPNTAENFRSIMLSRYPDPLHKGVFPMFDTRGIATLAERFQRAGFRTAALTGNGFWGPAHGHGAGWGEFVSGSSPPAPPYFGKYQIMCRADHIRRMAVDWLRARVGDDKRFLLWAHFLEPHDPYHAPEPWTHKFAADYPDCPGDDFDVELRKVTEYDRARRRPDDAMRRYQAAYDGSLAFADREIGALLEEVRALGLAENSLVVITADHGEGWGQHARYLHNNCLYDEEMNIPLIFVPPSALKRFGAVVDAITESVDLLPTLLDVAGIPAADSDCDGVSLLPAMMGETGIVKAHVFGMSGAEVFNRVEDLSATWSIRTQTHKLIHDTVRETYEFYHAAEDPGETRNLYDERDPICRELSERLAQTRAAWYARNERM